MIFNLSLHKIIQNSSIQKNFLGWRKWSIHWMSIRVVTIHNIESESRSVVSNSLQPHGIEWNSPSQNTGVGSCSLLQGMFPTQGSNPGLPHCRGILYQLAKPPRKSKNTGVGSPHLLQRIFLTQELNRHLLNCRRILYQLSYQERTHSQYYLGLILHASNLFYMLVAMSIRKLVAKPLKRYFWNASHERMVQHICELINVIHHINKIKDKSHVFDKIQHPFIIKIKHYDCWVKGRRDRLNWEPGIHTYMLLYIKYITNKDYIAQKS